MAAHPSLTQYWVYLPFDLTGKTVNKGKTRTSEVERFDRWKTDVELEAKAVGRTITVVLCSASKIREQLIQVDVHGGQRRYWFDDAVLTRAQIDACLDQAKAFAGPRYTEALDVVTDAHDVLDLFGGIGDFDAWVSRVLKPHLSELRFLIGEAEKTFELLTPVERLEVASSLSSVSELLAGVREAADVSAISENVSDLLRALSPLVLRARDLQEAAFVAKHGPDKDTPHFRQFNAEYMCDFPAGPMDAARSAVKVVGGLSEALSSPSVQAAQAQSLLLIGPAGAGKTHALVSAAQRRLRRGGYSLVVFGDDFGRAEPWEVLRAKLGLGSAVGREELFECIQACATNTGQPFVLSIDALNESPKEARWKDKLPELLQQCKPYPGLKICVSTRDTYRDLVVDARFPGFAFSHVGFEGREFEALQAFASFYGLDAEITPLFAAELTNPLFLHLACRTLRAQGKLSLDVSLPGFSALFEAHLDVCDRAIRERVGYVNPRNLVRAAMLILADKLVGPISPAHSWSAVVAALKATVGDELPPELLVHELQNEGLVILSASDDDDFVVRISYQRYGDVLRGR